MVVGTLPAPVDARFARADVVPVHADVVPVHAERTADPRTLHWYVGHGLAGIDDGDRGQGARVPAAALAELVDAGVLADADIADDHVVTTLGAGWSWADAAPTVRAAVQDTVRERRARLDALDPTARDAILARVARQVIADLVAPVASAHGGAVELVEATDGIASVRMRGACHGCPAAAATVRGRLERELRARLPWVVGLRVVDERGAGDRSAGDRSAAPGLRLLPWAARAACCAPAS